MNIKYAILWYLVIMVLESTLASPVSSADIATQQLEENSVIQEAAHEGAAANESLNLDGTNIQHGNPVFYFAAETEFHYDVETSNTYIEARDCATYYREGRRRSGVYIIRPEGFNKPFPVYCEMEKDGGGWTVIQRRGNFGIPDNYFNRNWNDYKKGFGNLEQEFWLGNDKISALTKQGKYGMKMNMIGPHWLEVNFTYGTFVVENELSFYRLTIGDLVNPPPSLSRDFFAEGNGMMFSTPESDNDLLDDINCAALWKNGWWYKKCNFPVLNGVKASRMQQKFTFEKPGTATIPLRFSQIMIRQ